MILKVMVAGFKKGTKIVAQTLGKTIIFTRGYGNNVWTDWYWYFITNVKLVKWKDYIPNTLFNNNKYIFYTINI